MKIVINRCYGGFGISHEGMMRYFEIKGQPVWPEQEGGYFKHYTYWLLSPEDRMEVKQGDAFYAMPLADRAAYNKLQSEQTVYQREVKRDDPALVQMVEEMGHKAWGDHAELKVVKIPDGIDWYIDEYDGVEVINEWHHCWS
jgi:hypothetical protein